MLSYYEDGQFTLPNRLRKHVIRRPGKSECDFWFVKRLPNGKYSYFNFNGERMMEADFYVAYKFFDGRAVVAANKTDMLFSYINSKGELAFNGLFETNRHFSEGLVPVSCNGITDIYLDVDGNQAFPGNFATGTLFLYGLALVEFTEGDWGYINKKGERIQTETEYAI